MNAKVIWNEGMRFTGSANSGFNVTLDADPGVGGADGGFRPLELLAISLASCTAMDVISILRKKKQDVTAFDVQVQAEQQAEHPHVFTTAKILYIVSGHNVDETAVRRAIELSALKYCPAQAMLSRAFPMQMLYEIYDDGGNGRRQLVKHGLWLPPAA
jgi:putative redox protein